MCTYPLSHFSILFSCKGKLSDMKSTWSQGPISQSQASLSHELWKVPQGPRSSTAPSRPPPGLTNSKPPSAWSGNSLGLAPGWNGSYSSGGCSAVSSKKGKHPHCCVSDVCISLTVICSRIEQTPRFWNKSSSTLIISDRRRLKMLNGRHRFSK